MQQRGGNSKKTAKFDTRLKCQHFSYTLLLIGITDIELVLARNDTAEDVVLVLVDNAKYILNYWPNMVISNKLKDFKVVDRLDIKKIKDKIGKI